MRDNIATKSALQITGPRAVLGAEAKDVVEQMRHIGSIHANLIGQDYNITVKGRRCNHSEAGQAPLSSLSPNG